VQSAGNDINLQGGGKMKKVIALTVTLLVMIGCASFVGYKVDQEAVAKINKGMTKFQVHNLIGIPDKAFYAGNGDVVWSYIYVPATVKAATVTPAVGPSAEVAKN
jgi:outer membrane protein assembly factor BamE (lipoprotein component of BamABCDE complex)